MARTPPEHLLRGHLAEERARRYLAGQGLTLVMRNYRSPYGEVDLIMRERDTLVFVEVRYRRNEQFGLAAETVDHRKQKKLRATAEHFLLITKGASRLPCRFDVLALSGNPADGPIHWYPNAF